MIWNHLSLVALQEEISTLGPQLSLQSQLRFHQACDNENVTLEIVQILHNILPEAHQLRNDDGWLPLHFLCCNFALDETASLDILRFMLSIGPTLPRVRVHHNDGLPIHYAVMGGEPGYFCLTDEKIKIVLKS